MNGEDNDQVPHHPEDKANTQLEESESEPAPIIRTWRKLK